VTDEQEGRWNSAFWRQNELAVICDSGSDPAGARVREARIRAQGLWFDVEEAEQRGQTPQPRFCNASVSDVCRIRRREAS